MGYFRPNTPAQSGYLDDLSDRPLAISLQVKELVYRAIRILGKYPNICSSVEPLMTLHQDYAPATAFRICLAMACLAPTHAPRTTWSEILGYATNLDLNDWSELVQGAMELLDMEPSDYIELVQAFHGLEQLSSSSN